MKTYQGVIFDLDGTTLDTIADLTDSVNEAMELYHFPTRTQEEYKQIVGRGFRNLILDSLPEEKRDPAIVDQVLTLFLEAYQRNFCRKTKPYPGIVPLLETLRDRGILMAINSNKGMKYTDVLISQNFPGIPFIAVCGEREHVPKKPDPTSALEIAGKMALSPGEVLYVGDTRTDMQTAHNAGMDCAGVLWGFRDREELIAHKATYLVTEPAELLQFFQDRQGERV